MSAKGRPPRLNPSDDDSSREEINRRDANLSRGVLAGDSDALRDLMGHHDRLVRFTIYRTLKDACTRDPHLIDAVASEVWTGFVASISRKGVPDTSIRAYLVRIARNKSADFLRRDGREPATYGGETGELVDSDADPMSVIMDAERVDVVRACMADMGVDDRKLFEEMTLLLDSRWREASEKLDMPESTLRSRWKSALDRLRRCVEKKIRENPENLAP